MIAPSPPDRVPLITLPTPLVRLERLGADFGVDLYVKRDDQTDVLLTGNKARKLEYVLADAMAAKADVLIVGGSAQSNLCRVATLAGARLGMRVILLLGTQD